MAPYPAEWEHRFSLSDGKSVFVRPIRNIVYLTPAFTIGEEDLECLTGAVILVLEQWTRL